MTVKELMNFLSKQNPDAKVTLTKDVDQDDGYEDAYYEDVPDKKEWPMNLHRTTAIVKCQTAQWL